MSRKQQRKIDDVLPAAIDIGPSIVQGSAVGPTWYIIMKIDLCPLFVHNDIFKYADDTTLLVPEHTDTSFDIDFITLLTGLLSTVLN